jgi:hypothetical protein
MGLRLEEFAPLAVLDADDFSPPWDLDPRPPFRVQAWHETNRIWPTSLVTNSFDEALTAACRALGPGDDATMVVLDEGFHVLFGYVAFTTTIVEFGAPVWYGCRAAYEWLERHSGIDRMDLAVWEATARDRAR